MLLVEIGHSMLLLLYLYIFYVEAFHSYIIEKGSDQVCIKQAKLLFSFVFFSFVVVVLCKIYETKAIGSFCKKRVCPQVPKLTYSIGSVSKDMSSKLLLHVLFLAKCTVLHCNET